MSKQVEIGMFIFSLSSLASSSKNGCRRIDALTPDHKQVDNPTGI